MATKEVLLKNPSLHKVLKKKTICLDCIRTNAQLTNLFTKTLDFQTFVNLRKLIVMLQLELINIMINKCII